MSQHFHLTWSSRDFCNSSKKIPKKKNSNLGLSLKFICFAETRGFELFKCKFFLKNIVCKAFFLHLFISKTGSFFKMKTWAFGPSCGQIALHKVLFHFIKMNCCAGGVVFDCFKSSCQCFIFGFYFVCGLAVPFARPYLVCILNVSLPKHFVHLAFFPFFFFSFSFFFIFFFLFFFLLLSPKCILDRDRLCSDGPDFSPCTKF